jgi:hypothetical protein
MLVHLPLPSIESKSLQRPEEIVGELAAVLRCCRQADHSGRSTGDNTGAPHRLAGQEVPATGRAQAVALQLGQGRVVVLGEAAMLTAQITDGGRTRVGMQRPGHDNRRSALDLMYWLSGRL